MCFQRKCNVVRGLDIIPQRWMCATGHIINYVPRAYFHGGRYMAHDTSFKAGRVYIQSGLNIYVDIYILLYLNSASKYMYLQCMCISCNLNSYCIIMSYIIFLFIFYFALAPTVYISPCLSHGPLQHQSQPLKWPISLKWRRGKDLLFGVRFAKAIVLNENVYIGGCAFDDDQFYVICKTSRTEHHLDYQSAVVLSWVWLHSWVS